jgi:starch synthase
MNMPVVQMERERQNAENIGIVGIADGDPFDMNTWSGSSLFFFDALKRHGCLKAAISGNPSKMINRIYQMKNFNWSLNKWRFKYHLDTTHYKAMTLKVKNELSKLDGKYTHLLQIYSHYDVPSIVGDKDFVKCAYQDGNLMRLLDSPLGYPKISSHLIKKALQWEERVFKNIDIIFTFSEWLRHSFINDYKIDPKRIYVVGAGANIPIPTISENRDYDGKTILFSGISFERKGGRILLKAFEKVRAEIPNAKLVIIGPNLTGLPDGVECKGYISKNTPEGFNSISQAYKDASIFVMPSLYEPFGVVFLEAMAHRLPCIGTDNCAMPEIINHKKTGYLVPVGDSESLARRIIELLMSPELKRQMGDNGYERFIENFSWKRVTGRMIEILRNNI